MCKLLHAAVAVSAIAAFNFVPQPAQALSCARVTLTAHGTTQGIATRKAERRLQRYVEREVTGARVGHASTTCDGVEGVRPNCKRSAIVCR
jgi:hypothetical protein